MEAMNIEHLSACKEGTPRNIMYNSLYNSLNGSQRVCGDLQRRKR
jgi:hypothetical protein